MNTQLPETLRTNETVWKYRSLIQNEQSLKDALHRLQIGRIESDSLLALCTKERTIRISQTTLDGIHYSGKRIREEVAKFSSDHHYSIQDTLNILYTEIVTNPHIYNITLE